MIGLALRGSDTKSLWPTCPMAIGGRINGFDLRRQDLYTQRVLKPVPGC